ncbi:MAG: 6,7-dimethyl-8-ribityllumazine synthase [Buchnera aphidicola (Eriosoma harunire)]
MKIIQSGTATNDKSVAIIISRFNYFINKNLLEASLDALTRIGNIEEKNITVVKVPGAYEIPIIAKNLAKKNSYNAIITLGTIIKGHTEHFKYINQAINHQLIKISLHYNIPIAFGILITDNIEQAIERSGLKMGNKGYEATLSILEMMNIISTLNNK